MVTVSFNESSLIQYHIKPLNPLYPDLVCIGINRTYNNITDGTFYYSSVSDLMIEMEDHTSDLSEARIPFLDYKTYTDRNFFLPSKDGANDAMITRKLQIPEARRAIVAQALNQFSNLLNSKTFLINVSLKL